MTTSAPLSRPDPANPDRHQRFALALVLLATFAVYLRSVNFDLVWDDVSLVLLNPWLESWKYAPRFFVSHMWGGMGLDHIPFHYRPMYLLWMLAMHQSFGAVPAWWHLASVLLHTAVTWLVYRMALLLTRDEWAALLAALLFGLYPVHVESVAWISASPDLLAGVGLLACYIHHLRWMEEPKRRGDRIVSTAWFLLAVMTKETALAFPGVVILGTWMGEGSVWSAGYWRVALKNAAKQAWPYVAVCAAFMAARSVAIHLQKGWTGRAPDLSQLPRLPLIYLSYFKMIFLTWRPTLFYNPDRYLRWRWTDALWLLAVVALLAMLLRRASNSPAVRLGAAWWLLMNAVPVMAAVMLRNDYWVQDRHLYLASIGFVIVVATVVSEKLRGMSAESWLRPAILMLVTLSFATAISLNLGRWDSEVTLFTDAYRHAPENPRARFLYARMLISNNRYDEAEQVNLATLRMDPSVWESYEMLAELALHRGERDRAMELLAQARQFAPSQYTAEIDRMMQAASRD